MKKVLLFLFLGTIITSCSKDERISKQIDGVWSIKKITISNSFTEEIIYTADDFGAILFNHSKNGEYIKSGESITLAGNSNFHYEIIDKGTKIRFLKIDETLSSDLDYSISNYVKGSSMWLTNYTISQGGIKLKTVQRLIKE
jgi:hypothetical protein